MDNTLIEKTIEQFFTDCKEREISYYSGISSNSLEEIGENVQDDLNKKQAKFKKRLSDRGVNFNKVTSSSLVINRDGMLQGIINLENGRVAIKAVAHSGATRKPYSRIVVDTYVDNKRVSKLPLDKDRSWTKLRLAHQGV